MSDQLVDIRTPLAVSSQTRVEIGHDGVLHVLAGHVTLHLDRVACEELATTLARAMVRVARMPSKLARPELYVVRSEDEPSATHGTKENQS